MLSLPACHLVCATSSGKFHGELLEAVHDQLNAHLRVDPAKAVPPEGQVILEDQAKPGISN